MSHSLLDHLSNLTNYREESRDFRDFDLFCRLSFSMEILWLLHFLLLMTEIDNYRFSKVSV